MMFLKGMFAVVAIMLISLGYGSTIMSWSKHYKRQSVFLSYTVGIMFFLALFTIVSVPATIMGASFHLLMYVGGILCFVGLLCFICMIIRKRKHGFGNINLREQYMFLKKYWWIIIPISLIVFQIVRSVFMMTSVYSDDKIYINRINDMIHLDTILETDPVTGTVLETARMSNAKFVLSSWVQFLAVICALVDLHPLVFIKTVFPIFAISFHYIIIWEITYWFNQNYQKRILMLLLYSVLMEFGSVSLRTDYSYYLFTWSWYGKSFFQFAIIPAILLIFLMIREQRTGWHEGLILMILCIAGLGSSTTALMLLPVELLLLIVFECISKKTVRELWISVPAFGPIAVGALLYFVLF